MTEEQNRSLLPEQLNEKLLDLRNEAIVQVANFILMGQKALHLSIGAVALTKDEVSELLTRLIERGKVAEADIQKTVNKVVDRIRARGQATDAELQEFAQKATVVLQENLRTLLEQVKLPGGASLEELLKTVGGQRDESSQPPTDQPEA